MGKNKRFVLNDEKTINSYGFSVDTAGIDTRRFEKNPVMLNSHRNNNESVIGRWEDISIENGLLMASPVFDTEDEQAKIIATKVERGFIKACSIGIFFKEKDLIEQDGKLRLVRSELFEASIVAVPSNADALRLYNEKGELYHRTTLKNLCLHNNHSQENNKTMKITLTLSAALALGFKDTTEVESTELSAKIEALEAARKTAVTQLKNIREKEEKQQLQALEKKVDEAIKSGKITTEKRASMLRLGIANPDLLDSTLELLPEKQSFSKGVRTATQGSIVKTTEDFQKLSLSEQIAFKNEHTDEYLLLFTKKQ